MKSVSTSGVQALAGTRPSGRGYVRPRQSRKIRLNVEALGFDFGREEADRPELARAKNRWEAGVNQAHHHGCLMDFVCNWMCLSNVIASDEHS